MDSNLIVAGSLIPAGFWTNAGFLGSRADASAKKKAAHKLGHLILQVASDK